MLIAKGDRLILYTDGLVEVFNSLDDMLGVVGLKALILESARRPIRKLKEAILNGVTTWARPPPTTYLSQLSSFASSIRMGFQRADNLLSVGANKRKRRLLLDSGIR
jgi:hypothetical protein